MAMTKKLVSASNDLKNIVREFGGLFILMMILAVVIGVLVQQSSSIGTTSAAQTNIGAIETAYDTQVTDNATSASGTTTSLVILAIILALFAGFISGKKSKSDGGLN